MACSIVLFLTAKDALYKESSLTDWIFYLATVRYPYQEQHLQQDHHFISGAGVVSMSCQVQHICGAGAMPVHSQCGFSAGAYTNKGVEPLQA